MFHWAENIPDQAGVTGLLDKLSNGISALEELQDELRDAVECYMEESDDLFGEADYYLDGMAHLRRQNQMLYMELNASRKEMLRLLGCLRENGLELPEGKYLHYSRLDPDLYLQDLDVPFYIQDPDEHFSSLLASQLEDLMMFEDSIPMTNIEREALRSHITKRSSLVPDQRTEWESYLQELRSSPGLQR